MLQQPDMSAKKEMAIIAYFHRLSTRIITILSDIVDATNEDEDDVEQESAPLRDGGEDDGEGGNEGPAVFITSADIAKMGLDEWSASDHAFVVELVKAYFGRRAHVEGMNIDICGIRIC